MLHRIMINNQEYVYDLTYKRMKSIRIKIDKGQIVVTCPYGTPKIEIETLILKNADKLLKAMDQYESPYDIREGGYVDLFGQRYTLRFVDDGRLLVMREGQQLIVHGNVSTLNRYLFDELSNYINRRIYDYLPTFSNQLSFPEIEFKNYKSRWGSCYYERHKVTFNVKLIHLDQELIDYVVLHELCHFLVHNHSKAFYHEIYLRMPDYQMRVQKLRGIHL